MNMKLWSMHMQEVQKSTCVGLQIRSSLHTCIGYALGGCLSHGTLSHVTVDQPHLRANNPLILSVMTCSIDHCKGPSDMLHTSMYLIQC